MNNRHSMGQMSHPGMKISAERCFFSNILTFGGVDSTFSLTDHFNASIFAMVESGNMSMP